MEGEMGGKTLQSNPRYRTNHQCNLAFLSGYK